MKKIFLMAASLAFITGSIVSANAQNSEENKNNRPKGGMLGEMDSNSDGFVTKDEFMDSSAKRFIAMDANKDGKVTEEEMKNHQETQKAEHEKRKKEMEAAEDKRFSDMDSDKDGKISKEEMKKHKESMHGKVGGESKNLGSEGKK